MPTSPRVEKSRDRGQFLARSRDREDRTSRTAEREGIAIERVEDDGRRPDRGRRVPEDRRRDRQRIIHLAILTLEKKSLTERRQELRRLGDEPGDDDQRRIEEIDERRRRSAGGVRRLLDRPPGAGMPALGEIDELAHRGRTRGGPDSAGPTESGGVGGHCTQAPSPSADADDVLRA